MRRKTLNRKLGVQGPDEMPSPSVYFPFKHGLFYEAISKRLPDTNNATNISADGLIGDGASVTNGFVYGVDYVGLNDNFGNGVTDMPFTISTWVKLGSDYNVGRYNTLYSKTAPSNPQYIFTLNYRSISNASIGYLLKLYDSVNGGNKEFIVQNPPLLDTTQYNHFAVSFDGNQAEFYINGVNYPVDSFIETGTYVAMNNNAALSSFNRLSGSGNATCEGIADEVAVFPAYFNSGLINQLYQLGLSGTPLIENPFKGLIYYLPLDGTGQDFSGYNNDFTVEAAATINNSIKVVGSASMGHDGSNVTDLIELNNPTNSNAPITFFQDYTNEFTSGCWVRLNNVNDLQIFNSSRGSGSSSTFQALYRDSTSRFETRVWGETESDDWQAFGDFAPVVDTWYHIVTVFDLSDPTKKLRLYIDGVEMSAANTITGNPTQLSDRSAGKFCLASTQFTTILPLDGLLDEAFLANYAYSPEEVLETYNKGLSGTPLN